MTRPNLKICLTILSFPVLLFSCHHFGKRVRGTGNVTTQDRSVSDFKNVEVDGAAKVLISQGSQRSVKVEADDNLQQFIEVYNEGDRIIIREKHDFNLDPSNDIRVYITSPVYNDIDASGAGDIIGQTPITNTEGLDLHLSGAGTIKLEVNTPHVSAELSGAGNVDLKGDAKSAEFELSGVGSAHCFDLKTENTKVQLSSIGSAQVYASVKLEAEVSGVGSVNYKGGAAVDQHVSGVGSVHKAD